MLGGSVVELSTGGCAKRVICVRHARRLSAADVRFAALRASFLLGKDRTIAVRRILQ
jgi:hypothetical protein